MNHNDFKRTGWNSAETQLTVTNVNSATFGKIFSREVDDQIYAQPLVLANFPIANGVHNIVIVATVNNSLYAFDADDRNLSLPYWKVNLTHDSTNFRPVRNSDMTAACSFFPQGYTDFSGNIGIVGTPAIDTTRKTLYVVARSKSKTGSIFVQYLHAIDLMTGLEKSGSPVLIEATYPGTGDGSVDGIITFNPQKQNQRAGLLLVNGIVYICWASHCGWAPYHGWMLGYDAFTLKQKYKYNTSPNGEGAGIWMSGQAPSVDDDGNILITTGNGTTGENNNPDNAINRGSSLVKLSPELKVIDFFTPANYEYLNQADKDYGINGPLIIPGTHLSLSGSKDGGLYLVDNNNMGHTKLQQDDVLQRLNFGQWGTVNSKHLHGSPVYYKDHQGNEYIYGWAQSDYLKQIPFNRTTLRFDTINAVVGTSASPSGYLPGGVLSLSSNGTKAGTGILWVSNVVSGNANHYVVPGILQAFDALDVTKELWNSNNNKNRDSLGSLAKFAPPTVANGKVYMATFSNRLNVYGILSTDTAKCENKGTGLLANYYSNSSSDENFPEIATIVKIEPNINFEWGMKSPDGISQDLFKAKFFGELQSLDSGVYKFYVTSDDGYRLWLNDQLLIDNWIDKSATEDTATITLDKCTKYRIRLEYYENRFSAVCKLLWSGPGIAKEIIPTSQLYPTDLPPADIPNCDSKGTGLVAKYYSDSQAEDGFPPTATVTKIEPTINFDWGMKSPSGISNDIFKAKFFGELQTLDSGKYYFYVSSDDGYRLWINNQLLLDKWMDKSASEDTVTLTMNKCTKYNIILEYYENRFSAVCKLQWSGPGIRKQVIPSSQLFPTNLFPTDSLICESTGTGLLATYFSDSPPEDGFPATPTVTKVESTINFDWGAESPPGITNDLFKARFLGELQSRDSGQYQFYISSDDGYRLWVNDQLLINKWLDKSASEDTATITLDRCTKYKIKLEYYENRFSAVCKLKWSGPNFTKQVIPTSQLYPTDFPPADIPKCESKGTGLIANYFSNSPPNEGFPTKATATKIEPSVNFDWGMGSPSEISNDLFKARFSGELQSLDSGLYNFYLSSDDGYRLWINDQLLIDKWIDKSASEDTATITLNKCTRYNIVLEYYENRFSAVCKLQWSGPKIFKQVVPTSQLFPVDTSSVGKVENEKYKETSNARKLNSRLQDNNNSPEDKNLSVDLVIYPNPNEIGYLNLLKKSGFGTGSKLIIYNSIGKQVMSVLLPVHNIPSKYFGFPINLSPGIYFIKIIGNNESHSSKLIIL